MRGGAYVVVLMVYANNVNCEGFSAFLEMLGGMVGSTYVIVSDGKWAMTCVSGNGSTRGR